MEDKMCTGDEAKCFPKFRKIKQGQLHLKCTPEAERLKLAYKRESASQSLFQRAVLPIEDVEKDALRVVKQMGWDPQNKKVVLGQFILQHGQYRGKNFLWLVENDPGYVLYLCRDEDKKKSTKSKKEGEDNGPRIKMIEKSLTEKLVEYAMLFNEYRSMKEIMYAQTKARQDAEKVGDKGLQLVGFGLYYNMTFEQLAKSSEKDHQSYCAWVKRKDNTRPGSSMHNFRNYLLSLEAKEKPYEPVQSWEPPELEIAKEKPKESHAVRTMKMRGSSDGAISIVSSLMNPIEETHKDLTDAELLASQMDDNNTPAKVETLAKEPAPSTYMKPKLPTEIKEPSEPTAEEKMDLSWQNIVSPAQERWMKKELRRLGLYPATPEYNISANWEGQSLWRTPPPGELQKIAPGNLPTPDHFWLHPMFVWSPEIMLKSLVPDGKLPCLSEDCSGEAKKKDLGKPRVVIGSGGGSTGMPDMGQYYIMASLLKCTKCNRSPWYADSPSYLSRLPPLLESLFPAHVTYRKAVCHSLIDQIRRSGRSPSDTVNEIKQLLSARYERCHYQYLQLIQYARKTNLSSLPSKKSTLNSEKESVPFGSYSCPYGFRGADVSEQFIASILVAEYNKQKPYLTGLLKGTFGAYWQSDHTRTVAKKVELLSGVMWSYSTLNEFWEIVSWVMVDTDSELPLANYYKGLSRRYELAAVEKASVRWVDRWCCVNPPTTSSKKGSGPSSASSKEGASSCSTDSGSNVVDIDDWSLWLDDEGSAESEIERKKFARKSSCRMYYNGDIEELLDSFHCIRRLGRACFSEAHSAYPRFLSLLANAFFIVDATDLEALKHARRHLGWTGEPSKKEVRRHCRTLIPPPAELEKRVEAVLKAFLFVKDSRGVRLYTPRMLYEWQLQRIHIRRGCLSDPGSVPLYRLVGHEHLGGVKSSETKLCVWQSLRGSSQLEGFHPHQSRWVTGSRVGPDLFQAQSFLGLIHWNLRRAAEHRNLNLPTVFDPLLTAGINKATTEEYGIAKYPDFKCNMSDTGELFGIDYKQEAAEDQQHQATVEKESDVLSDKEEDDTVLEVDASVQNELAQMMDESKRSKATSSGGKLILREKLKEPSVCIHPSIDTDSPEESGMTEPLDEFTDMELPSIKTPSFLPTSQQNLKPVPRLRPMSSTSRQKLKETTESPKSGMEKPTESHSKSDVKPNKEDVRKTTFSGTVKPWPPDQWSDEMKKVINNLLASLKGKPDKLATVEKEYLNILYASADDPTSRLKMTNKRFIQVYERSLNRRLEGNAAVNETDEQANIIDDISAKLAKTTDLTVHLVTPESSQRTDLSSSDIMSSLPHDTALKRPRSDISAEQDLSQKTSQLEFSDKLLAAMTKMESCANTLLAALSGVKANEMPSLSTSNDPGPSVAKKRKRVKDPKSGSNAAGRNCLYCGKPKSQMAGERNLHHTHIKRGEPGYFYCPEKVSKTYGTSPTMTFEEFRGTEHWESEMEVAKVRKEEKERKKAEAEEQRQRHGWKKPGNPKGYKFAK